MSAIEPLEQARRLLDEADTAPSLDELASAVALSPTHLQRTFRRRFGMSPAEYHRSRRFGQFKAALREGAAVTDAVYDAGFGSGSRVYEHSNRLLGMTPASYRAGGAGASIRYTTTATPLGRLLVATTTRGICAVTLGEDDPALERRLVAEFPHAARERVDAGREEWLDAVIARIACELGWSDKAAPAMPPLDIAATAFQWRVWNALSRIPAGETRSYRALAEEMGTPKAARAVGNACGNNRLALIVPCHRVVREDGSLGGWRWGVERKRELLARERSRARPVGCSAAKGTG
ncbi:methylated-DNA--[protein]-cysteine S-methyltransferase [Frateuria terrea]|uniref:methylated-DNA--[protein]-cysteine S-methyltransferase n=1 Tax=Frateuria terrea TaxID=529704 RepID=A0A1H6RSX1_9GAMM|nr:methylated-DNA--[protein]-cysteine S-methyltransferase [Frateuria terrea]SEI58843.1 AraC family transcriptional regulator, regulatory protein of adaptative response / methylated-DNA-[protein]-cysteine methyltransferase [Frateuria terrea]SFP21203.1 AraC family transcriptional regulator, regulatory protein of adaptative response / methylated-DNA-[protein]-cysteine methyltransferase [Frateuria terrea]